MDGELETEEHEMKDVAERLGSAHSSCKGAVNGHEGALADSAASDQAEEKSESLQTIGNAEEAEENTRNELDAADDITTSEALAVMTHEVIEQPMSHEESVVFEIDCNDDKGNPRLHLETPEREDIHPTQEEEDQAEQEEPAAEKRGINYEEYVQFLQQLCEERDKASQHSSRLQAELAEYFRKKARDDVQLERELPGVLEQLQEYEKLLNSLADLKQHLTTDSERAQQQAEELSSQSNQKLAKVEDEWRGFVALKQDVAVTVLSRRLGKQAALAKVESILATEQLRQDQLIALCLKNIKLRMRIHRLKEELRDEEEHAMDSLQVQFQQLQAKRLELKKQAEKQNEESLKVQKKISSNLEVMSNVKEKLFWSQMDVQAKREQLADMEAAVARKRDLLTRTKEARNSLQRDNLRLKERRGLLGNRVLLRDFEETVDSSNHLEEQLSNLKQSQAELIFRCGR